MCALLVSFLVKQFSWFPYNAGKNHQGFNQPLMAFPYSNICYCNVYECTMFNIAGIDDPRRETVLLYWSGMYADLKEKAWKCVWIQAKSLQDGLKISISVRIWKLTSWRPESGHGLKTYIPDWLLFSPEIAYLNSTLNIIFMDAHCHSHQHMLRALSNWKTNHQNLVKMLLLKH